MRRATCLLAASLTALVAAPAAGAHGGSPSMQSVVRAVEPRTPGVAIEVLNRDDRFQLTNRSGQTIVIYGYDDEPYARLLADGTVQINRRSPASYLNQDRYAGVPVPASARADAPPAWSTVDRTGRFQWHDHRMHYMGQGVPTQVEDRSQRQPIFDYRIPIRIGDRRGAIVGTLLWTPISSAPPVGLIAGLVAFAVVGFGTGVAVTRRRRRAGLAAAAGEPPREAW